MPAPPVGLPELGMKAVTHPSRTLPMRMPCSQPKFDSQSDSWRPDNPSTL